MSGVGATALCDQATERHWARAYRTAREAKGWTRKYVAARLGVPRTTLGVWERNIGAPPYEAANRWAALLGLNQVVNPAPEASPGGQPRPAYLQGPHDFCSAACSLKWTRKERTNG